LQSDELTVGDKAAQVADRYIQANAAIEAAGVSPDTPGANIAGTTVGEVNVRVAAALATVARLRGVAATQLVLLAGRLPTIKAAVDAIEAQATAVLSTLEPLRGASATDRNGHLALQLQHPEKGTVLYDLGAAMAVVLAQSNALLDQLPYVAQVAKEDAAPVFAGLVTAAGEQFAQTKDAAAESSKELLVGKAAVNELKAFSKTGAELAAQVQEVLTATTTQKTVVDTNAADIEQKLARTREISKDADTLQQRVTSFAAQFDAFGAEMKARLSQFAEFEASTKESQRANSEREGKIAELSEKADTMIRGATTAGLSKSLDDTKALYERRLQWTQGYFLASVVFLLICTLPIAAQLVPGPWQQYFTPLAKADANQITPWLSAIGKLVLLIPGTWATAFFASNYAELFHLSREYAHKAALAKAIDGFKREAPEYAQEIVGSVFMEIQDNPGSRKAPSPATPQNPITKRFIERVLEAVRATQGAK
jgi:hypothetical protein